MSTIEILFQDYVRNLRSNATSAIVLATRLEKASPDDMTPEEKRALKLVLQRAGEVNDVRADRDRLAPAKVRPLLLTCAGDWSSLADALSAKARVLKAPDGDNPATATYVSLFPNGMTFAQADAETTWSEAQLRLDRIEQEKLAHTIEGLIGPEFLEAVTTSTTALANAIGTGDAERTTPSSTAMSEALARFGRAVGRYGRALVASCDEEDAASVERFTRAVAPIDEHRAGSHGSSAPQTQPEPASNGAVHAATTTSSGTTPASTASSTGNVPAPLATSNGAALPPANGTPSPVAAA